MEKNRRLILNFIEQSEGESKLKSHLPDSHHKLDYWLQSAIARELGRDHLRIHGTGTLNNKFYLPYFPMVASSGCLTLKERSFGPLGSYNDQRILLDTMLENLGEEVSYHRETNIRGLLYVIEFDGKYQELKF